VLDLDETLVHCDINKVMSSQYVIDIQLPTGESIKVIFISHYIGWCQS